MESLILQSPFTTVVSGIVVVIVGVAAGMYMLDQWRDKKQQKKDAADDRLNGILEKTVKELSSKVEKLEQSEKELRREVAGLRNDNKLLTEILQGRDAQTQEFYKKAFESMTTSKETHALVTELVKSSESTNANIRELINLLSKNSDVLDHSISKIK